MVLTTGLAPVKLAGLNGADVLFSLMPREHKNGAADRLCSCTGFRPGASQASLYTDSSTAAKIGLLGLQPIPAGGCGCSACATVPEGSSQDQSGAATGTRAPLCALPKHRIAIYALAAKVERHRPTASDFTGSYFRWLSTAAISLRRSSRSAGKLFTSLMNWSRFSRRISVRSVSSAFLK